MSYGEKSGCDSNPPKVFVGKEENMQKTPVFSFLFQFTRFPKSSQTIFWHGCLEILIENLAWMFQFRPTDENLHFEAQFKMNNLPWKQTYFPASYD